MKRPLYKIQCSQLGIAANDIEGRLKVVLKRAERWGAILLLDEADVYIRARDTDINQNAIVGVMLRTVEYYNGIVFMTTNMKNIDDAIRSRATAYIHYAIPGADTLAKIWGVLSTQFEIPLSEKDCRKLADKWPNIVGRDVKNLMKLTKLAMHASGKKPTAEDVIGISQYVISEQK